ncbi:MAG: putative thiol-disulfide isomerase [Rhodospirillaceae bacterium]|nr:MAG: putative thiol-disulfide isomerase [Rhodospirillaceae bacterium]
MHKRTMVLSVVTTIALALVSIALWWADRQGVHRLEAPQRVGVLVPLDPPAPIPEGTVTTEEGKTLTLAEVHEGRGGRLTVLNLWASWCAPCVREMPSLDRLRQAVAAEGIAVLAVSEDATIDQARAFLTREGLTGLGLYHDPHGHLAQALGVRGLPSTYLLGPDRRVVATLEGEAEWDSPAMVTRLRALATTPASKTMVGR